MQKIEKRYPADRLAVYLAIAICACLFYAVSGGIRMNYGQLRVAISVSSGIGYEDMSVVLAMAQLSFGLLQPAFGILAMKKSGAFALASGAVVTIAGLLALPFCHSLWSLMLCLGFVIPGGVGGFAFGIIMGAVTPLLGERRAAIVSGFVSAGSGLSNIVLAPVLQKALEFQGLWGGVILLCVPTGILLAAAWWIGQTGRKMRQSEPLQTAQQTTEEKKEPLFTLLGRAMRSRTYVQVVSGFFACGFLMGIIDTHFYSQVLSYGLSEEIAAFAFSIYGAMLALSSVLVGWLCARIPMQKLLGAMYAFRVLCIAAFLLLPKNAVTVYLFIGALGFTPTVPPTSGLVSRIFGPRQLGTLFGMAFFIHQIGSSLSAWLGGVCLTATGSYTLIWLISAGLSIYSVFANLLIRMPKHTEVQD